MTGPGNFTKSGSGTLTLAAAQGYGGGTTVSNGTLAMGVANALPATSVLTLGDPTASTANGVFTLGGFNQTVAGLTVVAPSSSTTRMTGAGTLTINGPISFVNNAGDPNNDFPATVGTVGSTVFDLGGAVRNVSVAANANTNDLVIAAAIQNGGVNYTGTSVISTAAGMQFTGANTFTGGLTVNSGILNVSSTGTLGGSTNQVTINATGTAGVATNSTITIASAQTIGGLSGGTVSGTAVATFSLGSNTLTVNQSVNTTFGGLMTGTGGLSKSGTGTLALTGANSFSGALNVAGGTLDVNSINPTPATSQPLGASTAAITVGSATAGTLQYSGAAAATLNRQITAGGAGGAVIRSLAGTLTLGTAGTTSGVSGGGNPVTLDGPVAVAGIVSGPGTTLTKTGAGTATLTGVNSYTGNTTVGGGTLALSGTGSFANSPVIIVGPTAAGPVLDVTGLTGGANFGGGGFALNATINQTLMGYGTVVGNTFAPSGTTLAPGGSIGTETFTGNLTLDGSYAAEVDTTQPGQKADQLAVSGNLTLDPTSILNLPVGNVYSPSATITIATYGGTLTGTFGSTPGLPANYAINYGTGSNSAITLTPVPEPGTLALTGLALAGAAGWWKRRRAAR
jgi:fibronectin-binding autotransporter adhesin